MFFLFSKILIFILTPLTWIIALISWGLFVKKASKKRNIFIVALLVLLIFSNRFISNEAMRRWEIHPVPTPVKEKYDFAIVLGGFSRYDTAVHRLKLSDAGDRMWQALLLYEQKKVRKIFISGGSGQLMHLGETEGDKARDCLISMNVPEKDIEMEMTSRNTHENAVNTARWIMNHQPGARCLLITSASHMRRALGCFKKVKLDVTPFPADQQAEARKYDFDLLFFPDARAVKDWEIILKEMVGWLSYKVAGYL